MKETNYFDEIKEIAENIKALSTQAFFIYKPIVDGLCSRKTVNARELESILDELLSLCISDEILGLFKQVCRNFYNQYPEIITDYVMFYKEMYGEE